MAAPDMLSGPLRRYGDDSIKIRAASATESRKSFCFFFQKEVLS
jgi:hypothetical protein